MIRSLLLLAAALLPGEAAAFANVPGRSRRRGRSDASGAAAGVRFVGGRPASAASAAAGGEGDDDDDDLAAAFSDRFERWRFLQDVLEGDAEGDLADRALYLVLRRSLANAEVVEEEEEEEGALEITPEMREKMEGVLEAVARDRRIPALGGGGGEGGEEQAAVVEAISTILPDPLEDEDAHKSAWDVVVQLHGVEMVKIEEREQADYWRAANTVVRLLIHHDFLETGVEVA